MVVSDPAPPSTDTIETELKRVATGGPKKTANNKASASSGSVQVAKPPASTAGGSGGVGSAVAASPAKLPKLEVPAGQRGKRCTDLPKFSASLLEEYCEAGCDSVFFRNDQNHAQLRSIVAGFSYSNVFHDHPSH